MLSSGCASLGYRTLSVPVQQLCFVLKDKLNSEVQMDVKGRINTFLLQLQRFPLVITPCSVFSCRALASVSPTANQRSPQDIFQSLCIKLLLYHSFGS